MNPLPELRKATQRGIARDLWLPVCLWLLAGTALAVPKVQFYECPANGTTVNFTTFQRLLAEAQVPRPDRRIHTTYRMKDITVVYDVAVDKPGMDGRWSEGGAEVHVTFPVQLNNITFDPHMWFLLRNYTFEYGISVQNCKNVKWMLRECTFLTQATFSGNEIDFVNLKQCTFRNGLFFSVNQVTGHLTVSHCTLGFSDYTHPEEWPWLEFGRLRNHLLTFNDKAGDYDILVEHCRMGARQSYVDTAGIGLNFWSTRAASLTVRDNDLGNVPVNFNNSKLENGFFFARNQHLYYCGEGFSFNPANSDVEWGVEGFNDKPRGRNTGVAGFKLAVLAADGKRLLRFNPAVYPRADSNLYITRPAEFQRLIASYFQLYNYYKETGNQDVANFCYYELKTVQTVYYRLMLLRGSYDESYRQTLVFKYWGNVFLRTFCDYGLNPFKAILVSFYVLLGFSFLYWLLPVPVLQVPYTLWDLVRGQDMHHTMPKLMGGINRIAALLPSALQRWAQRPWVQRQVIWPFQFLVLGWARLLACIMMSLNTFILLAAGEVPYRGYMLYLLILEGVFGWMLLTVFSVTLISQLIQ